MAIKTEQVSRPELDPEIGAIQAAIERAEAGDASALPAIRDAFDKFPVLVRSLGGDLAQQAIEVLLKTMFPKQLAAREAVRKQVATLRAGLAGDKPNPLERLLVERIVVCWLHAYHADVLYGQAGSITFAQGEYLQRQQDRAQRHYLSAIKSLATVRRLALPIKVDVCVAGKLETTPTNGERALPSRLAGALSAN